MESIPTSTFRYASFWKRLTAYGYDSLIVTVIAGLVSWQLGSVAFAQTPQDIQTLIDAGLLPAGTNANDVTSSLLGSGSDGGMFAWSDFVLPMMVSALYNIFFLTGDWQATPGKRWCGIKVVNADGSRLTLAQSAWRHAASGLSSLLLGLPYLTICFTLEKTAPHDMLCGTRVVMRDRGAE